MSIFGTIMSKVFGSGHPAASEASAPAGAPAPTADSTPAAAPPTAPTSPSPDAGAAPATVDVAAVLDGMEENAGQTLDWRHSIVDLMKLLGMDSSLSARKELAGELHYTGDTSDSASMNIWLHKEVMSKFAANGGKLPADLH
jgi:hypothetical protein